MRILIVNKYHYLRSGSERYLFNLKHLLESKGHHVEVFAMQHPRNRAAPYASYFMPAFDFHRLSPIGRVQAAGRVIWSREAARRIGQVLDQFRPDLVHLLNIYHHLSPAILPEISRRRIPIVQTLNDYKLLCPNYQLYTQGQPCTRCRNGNFFQAVKHRCLHQSSAWSLLAAVEMTLHKFWRVYERHVQIFLAPSRFLQQTAVSFGIPAAQLIHLPHFLYPVAVPSVTKPEAYFAYFGRLAPEKGLTTLIQAMRLLPQTKLLLVGAGPSRPDLEKMVADWDLTNIRFTGYLQGDELWQTISRARFTVVPSEWYEVFGFTIIETLMLGRPVVAAHIGGMPELVQPGVDGLLFPPGDVQALAACLQMLWQDPAKTQQMGQNGRQKVLTHYQPDSYYQQLFALYGSLA